MFSFPVFPFGLLPPEIQKQLLDLPIMPFSGNDLFDVVVDNVSLKIGKVGSDIVPMISMHLRIINKTPLPLPKVNYDLTVSYGAFELLSINGTIDKIEGGGFKEFKIVPFKIDAEAAKPLFNGAFEESKLDFSINGYFYDVLSCSATSSTTPKVLKLYFSCEYTQAVVMYIGSQYEQYGYGAGYYVYYRIALINNTGYTLRNVDYNLTYSFFNETTGRTVSSESKERIVGSFPPGSKRIGPTFLGDYFYVGDNEDIEYINLKKETKENILFSINGHVDFIVRFPISRTVSMRSIGPSFFGV